MIKEELIRENIANNLKSFRLEHNLTQTQLAEKLNYSDKSISKWERKEGVPDIVILARMADLYHIDLDDFVKSEKKEKPVHNKRNSNSRIITSISFIGVWFIATILFSILSILSITAFPLWMIFIYAIPISVIVLVVFSSVYKKRTLLFIDISLLLWSIVLSFVMSFHNIKIWLLFVAAAPVQIMIFLWARLSKNKMSKF